LLVQTVTKSRDNIQRTVFYDVRLSRGKEKIVLAGTMG
jgi:hypothetical protein